MAKAQNASGGPAQSARAPSLDLDFDVSDPPDLMEHLRKLADRCGQPSAGDPSAHYLGKVSRAWNRFVSGMKWVSFIRSTQLTVTFSTTSLFSTVPAR